MKLTPHEIKTVKDLLMEEWSRFDWMSKEPEISPIRQKNMIKKADSIKAIHSKFDQIK